MKKLILSNLASLLLLASTLNAQSYAIRTPFEDWRTTSGTQNHFFRASTITDASNYVYVAGAAKNGSGNYDLLSKNSIAAVYYNGRINSMA
jgi:hypothetical protein